MSDKLPLTPDVIPLVGARKVRAAGPIRGWRAWLRVLRAALLPRPRFDRDMIDVGRVGWHVWDGEKWAPIAAPEPRFFDCEPEYRLRICGRDKPGSRGPGQ